MLFEYIHESKNMFNNNRVHLVMFAAVMCMQIVHGTHYRKNKKLLPPAEVVTQIKDAQAEMRPEKPFNPVDIIIPLNIPYTLSSKADEEGAVGMCANVVGCCAFTLSAACILLTAHSSL
jgi:hypothetical protein